VSARAPVEFFPALSAIKICRHAFIERVPGIDVSHDKAQALQALEAVHREARRELGIADWPLLTAQQVHGNKIALIDSEVGLARCADRGRRSAASLPDKEFAGCDGFITNQHQIALGIHVADCCAVYLVDPKTPAIGLVHSGKKGTEQEIAAKAIEQLREKFGSNPADLIVQLSPCIRPPHYEIDFGATIVEQCRNAGVKQIFAASECTACDTARYYSYRAEKGKTGRMLALLGLL
jgi:copper oxidase (laccase) domain-containing protein